MSEPTAEQTPESDAPAPAGWKVKSKFLGIGLLIGLLGGGALSAKIAWDGSVEMDAMEEAAKIAETRDSALQARASVAAAETELEQENFGSARKHLEVAKRRLAEVSGSNHLDAEIIETISTRLNKLEISTDGANSAVNTALDEIGLALDRELLRSN